MQKQNQPDLVRPKLRSDGHTGDPVPREDAVHRTWKRFRLAHGAKPIAGAVIIGGAALVLATEVGATELAIGALAAYVTYRMMRYGVSLKEALTEGIEIEEAAAVVA